MKAQPACLSETNKEQRVGLRLGFALLRRTTRQQVNKTTSGASLGLRVATPDYETTSPQDNKWRLRLSFALLRRTTRLLVNKTTSGGFANVSPDDYVDL